MPKTCLALLSLIALSGCAISQGPAIDSPEGLVAGLYRSHADGLGPFQDVRQAEVYFTPSLAALIRHDADVRPGFAGRLDFDPLCDGQESDIRNLRFEQTKLAVRGRGAEVRASFKNSGQDTEIFFDLVLTDDGWRIGDIRYPLSGRLVRLLGDR